MAVPAAKASSRSPGRRHAPKPRRHGKPKKRTRKRKSNSMKRMTLTVALVGTIVVAGAVAASADVSDSWITTKAKIALLTTDGFSVNGANVDTIDGNVTMHGKVATTEDRTRAERRSAR